MPTRITRSAQLKADVPAQAEFVMKRPMLSIREARTRLSFSDTTMRRLISDGLVPAAKILGAWRIDPDDLERFIEDQKAKTRGVEPAPVIEAFNGEEQLFT